MIESTADPSEGERDAKSNGALDESIASRKEANSAHTPDEKLNLDELAADQVVEFFRTVGREVRDEERLARLDSLLYRAIQGLPATDAAKAKTVVQVLAASESPYDRRTASAFITYLWQRDPEFAEPLWQRLLADEQGEVRDAALEAVEDGIAEGRVTLAGAYRVLSAYFARIGSRRES